MNDDWKKLFKKHFKNEKTSSIIINKKKIQKKKHNN